MSGTVPFIRARPSRAMAPRPVALLDAAAAGWADAAAALHGAVVYLDEGAAAAVAPLGLPLLLGLGALAACDLAQPRPSVRAAAHAQSEALGAKLTHHAGWRAAWRVADGSGGGAHAPPVGGACGRCSCAEGATQKRSHAACVGAGRSPLCR